MAATLTQVLERPRTCDASPAAFWRNWRYTGGKRDVRLDFRNGAHVAALVSPLWPLYSAGIDQDDEIQELDGRPLKAEGDLAAVLGRHKPGDSVSIVFVDRSGVGKTVSLTLKENPHLEVVPAEAISPAQQGFRDRWLKSRS